MGYTHYWSFGPFIDEKNYKAALADCRKIIRNSPVPVASWNGEGKPILRNGFNFNGAGDDSHENFTMGSIPDRDPRSWPFCKTERKPYDVVVVACLCAIEDRIGQKAFNAESDGDPHEWEDGRNLAQLVLGRPIRIPQSVIDQVRSYGWYARKYRKEHPEYTYTPLDISHPNWRNETVPEYAKG